tara:strand:- start:77 stop:733 length:657 start_codon:yes stop_codon:yes gene_type:complete
MIVPINKPIGWTSFDVVKQVRKITGEKKVGHGGTLDPFAQGVLVVGIGRNSTRRLNYFSNSNKTYEAKLKLGSETDTLDLTGKIIQEMDVPTLKKDKIKSIFSKFTGYQEQIPPMFSAKKIRGVRLYKLARQKKLVEREPIQVFIKLLELIDYNSNSINFLVSCSKGTYVRQLGSDIAKKLGTVGHLAELYRIQAGPYSIEDCISFSTIEKRWMSLKV